jgi:hypothetical protein
MRPLEKDCPINILEGAVRSGKTWCLHSGQRLDHPGAAPTPLGADQQALPRASGWRQQSQAQSGWATRSGTFGR